MYIGSLVSDISLNFSKSVKIFDVGLPVKFFNSYGSEQDQYKETDLTPKKILKKIKKVIELK